MGGRKNHRGASGCSRVIDGLDKALIAAHEMGDHGELVQLYRQASAYMLTRGQVDAGCFFLTQAYVFALEIGAAEAPEIRRILVTHGREA